MKFIAIDQHGSIVRIQKYPRKELMENCGRQHIAKLYRDDPSDHQKAFHCGYIVAGRWFTVYKTEMMQNPA